MDKDFKMDMTPLDEEQMKVMKKLIEMNQNWLDQVKKIMINHGLWKKGFTIQLSINPGMKAFAEEISIYRTVIDGDALYDETISMYKGSTEIFKNWQTLPQATSREYIHLFDTEEDGNGKKKGTASEKPLPADGLWIGDPADVPADSGVVE